MWDTHMHSSFSGDCEASPESMIEGARAKNLEGIIFTDHLDIDYPEEPNIFDLDVKSYYAKQSEIANKYSSSTFSILTGIEVGIKPDISDKISDALKDINLDYIIGSTHVVDNADPYYPAFWEKGSQRDLLTRYYQVILENINAYSDFDSLAHLDYCFRYTPVSTGTDTYTDYAEIIDEILKILIKKDKALEINTGVLAKGFSQPNPCLTSIRRYKELGGRLITIGADAHTPENIAAGFNKLPELLNSCGFNEYAVFKKRQPTLYKL